MNYLGLMAERGIDRINTIGQRKQISYGFNPYGQTGDRNKYAA